MFAYIKGTLEQLGEDSIVVECGGIGYKLFITGKFREKVPTLHKEIVVFTYMYVREDELSLYGFYSQEELDTFKLLIGISGIGPKAALAILSALSVKELSIAVMSDDVAAIKKANGVGAKGAQRVILDLKDKLKIEDVLDAAYQESLSGDSTVSSDSVKDGVLALTSLGYSSSEAMMAVQKVEGYKKMSADALLKEALKNLI